MGTASSTDNPAESEPLPIHVADPVPLSSCPFLLSFARDASAQFSLSPFISLMDLASLNASCRSWRQWMLFPPAVACGSNGGGRHWSRFRSTTLIDLAKCPWARGLLTELRANPERRSKEAQASDAAWDAQRNSQAMSILRTLPRFPRLECLRLIPTFGEAAESATIVDAIRTCFSALPRLARLKLSLELWSLDLPSKHSVLALLMQCIDQLPLLRELSIEGPDFATTDVSFERLLLCPALRRLDFVQSSVHTAEASLQLSQLILIAQCTQLESLSCKSLHVPDMDPALVLRRFVEVRLESERSNHQRRADAEASGAASEEDRSKPVLPVSTLTHLDLRTTDLQVESMLPLLAQFPALTDISPRSWTTAQPRASADPHWAHLATFKQLRTFRLDSRTTAAVQDSLDAVISNLTQCVLIQHLTLDSLVLSDAQLYALVRSVRAMDTLVLHRVQFESLDALSEVAALTSLSVHDCALPPLPRITLRGFVPRLPELLRLSILDSNHLRLTAARAAPLNDLLMQRCPKLVRNKYEENLVWP